MLTSLQMEEVKGIDSFLIKKLTLKAPTLREVKIMACSGLRLEIVPGESV